jgi:hypothetical protein
MGLKVRRIATCVAEQNEPSFIIGPVGRQLYTLAQDWPELRETSQVIGIYHALGREKEEVHQATIHQVRAQGFDSLRASAIVFEHLPYGPFAQLAITHGCTGPFWTLQANELAASLALWTAWHDLQQRRCDMALVGAYHRQPPVAWLLLMSQNHTNALEPALIYTYGQTKPTVENLRELKQRLGGDYELLNSSQDNEDANGFQALYLALTLAQSGTACATWSCTPDGRGTLLGFRPH